MGHKSKSLSGAAEEMLGDIKVIGLREFMT